MLRQRSSLSHRWRRAASTSTTSYALQADTSTTAILKIVETVRATDDPIVSTDTNTFGMTPAG